MKYFAIFILCFYSATSNAGVIALDSNFGMASVFDEPTLIDWYPNTLDLDYHPYTAYLDDFYESDVRVKDAYYFGFKFALSDYFIWNDGGWITEYSNGINNDFVIKAYANGQQLLEYKVEDTGSQWLFGSAYSSFKSSQPISQVNFQIESVDGMGGFFLFDSRRTAFYIGDKPLAFVPESSTLWLFLCFAGSLVIRREFF